MKIVLLVFLGALLVSVLLLFFATIAYVKAEDELRLVNRFPAKYAAFKYFEEKFCNGGMDYIMLRMEYVDTKYFFEATAYVMKWALTHNLLVYFIMDDETRDKNSAYTFNVHYLKLLELAIHNSSMLFNKKELKKLFDGGTV